MNKETEVKPAVQCLICLPDMTCKMVGELGKIDARITTIPALDQSVFVWEKIEKCTVRQEWLERFHNGEIKSL